MLLNIDKSQEGVKSINFRRICNLKSITHCRLTQLTIELSDTFIMKTNNFANKGRIFLHGLKRELVKLGSILLLGFADPIQSEDY